MRTNILSVLYRKEMLDVLRDRRTLFTMIVLPILTMPLSLGGTNYFLNRTQRQAEQQQFRIALPAGSAHAPMAAALRAAGFEVRLSRDVRADAEAQKVDAGLSFAQEPARLKVTVYSNESDVLKSSVLRARISDTLTRVRQDTVRAELLRLRANPELARPLDIESVNLAPPRQLASSMFSNFLTFIVMMFMVNGAMYAAVDMTAGEKERRTMETLLSSAAHRSEIVVSKVLASATVCLVTASLSVLTLVATMRFLRNQNPGASKMFDFPADPATLALIGLALLPMTVLASSACVALATPARSTREAMSYVTPVMFLAVLFAATAFIPGLESNRSLDFVPIANFARMMKQIVGGQWSWAEFGIALASNTMFAIAAVAFAIRKFQDERILFRV